jgi:hypothetical protein
VRADAIRAERHQEVRAAAARSWQQAGAIGDESLQAILAGYPDDRSRLGPVFRFLVFVFTVIAVLAGLGLVTVVVQLRGEEAAGLLLMVSAVGLAILTEVQIGPLKREGGGAEAATAFLAVTFAVLGVALVFRWDDAIPRVLVLATVLFGLAAWHWGYPAFAAFAAVCLYLRLASLPWPRLVWVAVGGAAVLALLPLTRAARPAPSHRRSAAVIVAVSVVAVYVASHLASWDQGWVESLAGRAFGLTGPREGRLLFAAATAVVPILVLAGGVLRRDRLLLNVGAVLAIASLATLRYYVHVAPAWVVLTVSGLGAMGVALLLRRLLGSGPDAERAGFTARPLYDDARQRALIEAAAVVVTASPATASDRPAEAEGRGGRFGGGGASTTY